MTWTDYKIPTVMVPDGQGVQRPVRGLSLEDISELIVNHLDEMMEVTSLYVQTYKDVAAVTNMTDMIVVASKSFPKLVGEIVAMVTDTPALADVRLPVALQITILSAAAKLTVEDAGGLGNLSAILQDVVRQAVAGRGEVSRKLQDILSPSSTLGAGKTSISS